MIKFLQSLVFFVFLATSLNVFSQVGIGTSAPDLSSILDVQSTNRGILIPRVSLTSTTDVSTIANPVESLFIYNTASRADVTPGFYYWDGISQWIRFKTGAGTAKTPIMMRRFNATFIGDDNTSFNFPRELFNTIEGASYSTTNSTLRLPQGIYKIQSNLKLVQKETVQWSVRLNGSVVPANIPGRVKVVSDNSDDSNGIEQFGIIEITDNTGVVDFIVQSNTGFLRANVTAAQCYVIITKIG